MTAVSPAEASLAALDRLGIVGAGVMGTGIAQIAAQAGIVVTVVDNREGAAAAARERLLGTLGRLADKGKIASDDARAAGERVRVGVGNEALADCGLVVEAIVERLEAKRALLRELERIVAPDAVLATNTSSLSVTAIGAALKRPAQFAGFHFFNPVPLMRVVEVIGGPETDPAVCAGLDALARRLGHTPIAASDTPGFVVNHGGRGYGTEALRIAGEGIADYATIDRILRGACGFKMGPFELFDLTGLDVSHPVMESIYDGFYHEPRFQPSPITRQRLAGGLLGRKTGRGFYRYDAARADEAPRRSAKRPAAVHVAGPDEHGRAAALVKKLGARVVDAPGGDDTLCVVAPVGDDVSTVCAQAGLDPTRTVGLDTLFGLDSHRTLMATPVTTAAMRDAATGLFAADGVPVDIINDSPGFVAQRVVAVIVAVACEMAQRRIAAPADIDRAIVLGLGYPHGPLAWGDRLGPSTVTRILAGMQHCYEEPRYRAGPWLRRRAQLGLSLLTPDVPE